MLIRAIVLSLLAVPLLAAAPVANGSASTRPQVTGAWVRAAAVPGRPAAGYLTLTGGAAPDTLVGATSPGLRIELHSMSMAGGVMKMAKLDSVPVPAGAKVAFATGGNHLMIFGMTGAPRSLPLTLQFLNGKPITTVAEVRAPGATPPAGPHAGH